MACIDNLLCMKRSLGLRPSCSVAALLQLILDKLKLLPEQMLVVAWGILSLITRVQHLRTYREIMRCMSFVFQIVKP